MWGKKPKPKRKGMSADQRRVVYLKLYKQQDGQCPLCGCSIADGRYSHDPIDHIIPWSKGGADCLANYQIVHTRCNAKKHAREGEAINIRLEWRLRFKPKKGQRSPLGELTRRV